MHRIQHPARVAVKKRRSESGSALIPVLALIMACSMIVTAVIGISQLNTYTMSAHTRQQRSQYVCEGAANRIQWLVAAERTKHPNISYQTFDYGDTEYDRFLPDGVEHTMDYHGVPVKFRITDAAAGLDFSARMRNTTLNRLRMNSATDTEYQDVMEKLRDQITDYTDSNDVVSGEAFEKAEYEERNQTPLPRNATFQYREELFYLPEFMELFPPDKNGRLSAVRVIPPDSMMTIQTTIRNNRGGTTTRRTNLFANSPNLFGAPSLYLQRVFNLEDGELEELKEGIRLYQQEKVKLSDAIDSTLFQKIRRSSYLTWTPGNVYTVEIEPYAGEEKMPAKRLVFTWTGVNQLKPADNIVRYLEWMFY